MVEIRNRTVMQQVENANASEGFRNDMCENGRGRARVKWCLEGEEVIELRESVDYHENVTDLESG